MGTYSFSEGEVKRAFERFVVWCREREIPADVPHKFMLMYDDGQNYQFKNAATRNYIYVNKEPKAFNL